MKLLFNSAIIVFLSISFIYGQSACEHYKVGLFKYSIGDYEAATHDFSKTAALSPGFENVYVKLGMTKYHLNEYHGAINDFTSAINISATNATAFTFRGMSNIKLGNYEEALSDLNDALALYPDDEFILLKSAYSNYLIEEFEKALELYDKVILQNEFSGEAFFYRGVCKYKLGNIEGGCKDIRSANKLKFPEAYEAFIKSICN